MALLLVPASVGLAAAQDVEADRAQRSRMLEAGALRFSAEALPRYDRGGSVPSREEVGFDAGAMLGSLPLVFVQNEGQWDTSARFVARRGDLQARLEDDAVVLQLTASESGDRSKYVVVRLAFEGCSSDVRLEGEGRLRGTCNYFLGNDRSKWRADVPCYSGAIYRGLHQGVDLRVREEAGDLEYDVLLAPRASLDSFVVRCEGIETLEVDSDGSLVMGTEFGEIRQKPAKTFVETRAGERREVECRYRRIDAKRFGFVVLDRNPEDALLIDPGLEWSTFLGGSLREEARAMVMDPSGSVTLTGWTRSSDFPRTPGAFDESYNGADDGFVTRLDPSQSGVDQLVWSTFIGGSGIDVINSPALDSTGMIITVTGLTESSDFPTTSGAYDETHNGNADAIVVRFDLNQTGTGQLDWSTYIGGSEDDYSILNRRTVESSGIVTISGGTQSSGFPTTAGAYDTSHNSPGLYDGFVARFDPAQTGSAQLVYSTFLGGSSDDAPNAVEVDEAGEVIVGSWSGPGFPVTQGACDESFNGGTWDATISQLQLNGAGTSDLVYSTYLGGSDNEGINNLQSDDAGELTITGTVASADFPTTSGAYDESFNGPDTDAFVCRLDLQGSCLLYSTFLGGAEDFDYGYSLALDVSREVTLSGTTGSTDFPTTSGAYDSVLGLQDAFVTRMNLQGNGAADLVYSTYLGGTAFEYPFLGTLNLDESSYPIVAGSTNSSSFPTTPDAYDTTINGGYDVFVTRLCIASWRNYGVGWPGTQGIPSLDSSDRPVLGTTVNLGIGNSLGSATTAILFVGFTEGSLPTTWGAPLLLLPAIAFPISLPAGGASLPASIPSDDALCGVAIFLQVIEGDPGASKGVSFTPGLRLNLGG